jgi:transposase-like protein
MVATLVRGIFAQSDEQSTWAAHGKVVQQLEKCFPDAAKLLDQAAGELLAFTAFPKAHWKQIWSNNPQERLNKERRRRSAVVGIFSNRAAIFRLLGAVLAERHDEWAVIRRYLRIIRNRARPAPYCANSNSAAAVYAARRDILE